MSLLAALGTLRRALDAVGRVMNAVAGWLIIVCALLITADILGREFLGHGVGATLEISSYILALSISWGLAHALAERQHVRIDLLVSSAPLRLRQFLHFVALLAMVLWCVLLAYGAVTLVLESSDFGATDRSTLAIPLVLPQGLWAAGIVFFLLFATVLLLEIAVAILLGRPEHVEGLLGPRTLAEEAQEALDALAAGERSHP